MQLVPSNDKIFNCLLEWSKDDDIGAMVGMPYSDYLKELLQEKYDGLLNFLVGVEDTNGDIRGVYFAEGKPFHKRVKVDLAFDKVGRGKILLQSLKQFIDYVFLNLGYETMICEIPVVNNRSYRCAKKIGFKEMCLMPEYINIMGKQEDAYIMMLTQEMRCI